jgi:hypothetical protein
MIFSKIGWAGSSFLVGTENLDLRASALHEYSSPKISWVLRSHRELFPPVSNDIATPI